MTEFYWHVHHHVLCEPLIGPIEQRVEFIKQNKPESEIETRLKLMKPVQGELPATLLRAGDAYSKGGVAYRKAEVAYLKASEPFCVAPEAYNKGVAYAKVGKAYEKTRKAYDKALEACQDEIESLHKQECKDCPWDGETIFPKERLF